MKVAGIDLPSLLRFDQAEGLIRLQTYRMVLLSACALGALRRELIDTLGWQRARGVMKRFGHAAGLADGLALNKLFPDATVLQHMEFGPALHGLEGVANVVRIPELCRIDPEHGELHIEAYWENSYEAEQHLELFGPSEEPVCWTLAGYATGHSSSAGGERTVVVEKECRAQGAERCRFVVGYAKDMPEAAKAEEPDYEKDHLPEVLQQMHNRMRQQSRTLRATERKVQGLEAELSQYRRPENLVGDSPRFEEALAMARTVAPVDSTVLLLGESGTGKEGLARFLHDQSLRSSRPFIAVNCSALPETLQEAELFGYAKGAFTGASTASAGVFEAAHKGTLFLDEVGDLSVSAQTKILRALQEGEIKRLGETQTRRVDVRVVAATHRDLRGMLSDQSFREDLFYRLSVITIQVPPLRDRGHDRLLLAEHFRQRFARKLGRSVDRIAREARAAIAAYRWPGNVRELQNAMERAVILSANDEVNLEDLPVEVRNQEEAEPPRPSRQPSVSPKLRQSILNTADEGERIWAALQALRGNRDRAASLLGMSRTTLWRRMRKFGLLGEDVKVDRSARRFPGSSDGDAQDPPRRQ